MGWGQGGAEAGELPVGDRAVGLDRIVLERCARQLWELLALPSSLLRAREFPMPWTFYRELSGTTRPLPGEKMFREVFELGGEGTSLWMAEVAALAEEGEVAFISPRWKPRPGARLLWSAAWDGFEICGTHREAEVSYEERQRWEAWGDKRGCGHRLLGSDPGTWSEVVEYKFEAISRELEKKRVRLFY